MTPEVEFERCFLDAGASAVRLARSLGRSPEDSAEVVQEAAMQAWRYRDGLRGEWRPWFLSIVYRMAKRRNPVWLPLPFGWDRAGSTWPGQSEPDPMLAQALSRLPARQRAAVWLRYGEDMAIDDVAHVLETTPTAAKQLLARARGGLRERYEGLAKGDAR